MVLVYLPTCTIHGAFGIEFETCCSVETNRVMKGKAVMFRKGQGLVGCEVVLMFSLLWPSNACNSHKFITVIAESDISSFYFDKY